MNHLSRERKTALSTVQVPLILTRLPCSDETALKQEMKPLQQTYTVSHSFSILTFAFASRFLPTYPHCRASFSKYIRRYKPIPSKRWYFPLHPSGQLRKHRFEMASRLTLKPAAQCHRLSAEWCYFLQ